MMTNETNACETDFVLTGLSDAVLAEIVAHHSKFCDDQIDHIISLRGLPMTKGDIQALDEKLGHGEVSAKLDVVGESQVWETKYSGIWRVRHFSGDRVIVDEVAICKIPEILISHIDDIKIANQNLVKLIGKEIGKEN